MPSLFSKSGDKQVKDQKCLVHQPVYLLRRFMKVTVGSPVDRLVAGFLRPSGPALFR
ncbi:hypothetical protein NC99_42770 [Sunxiuqinia dokdonensis]|uniref:Uncharacterized protein n=1 Tax=Sunxiuqinia dokdonensis TaxID=1409788 RepID=A0A0L8V338_9BACT|nr:hypothetical protein NC99_42770 [Sunxiuqinia dokdonensis]